MGPQTSDPDVLRATSGLPSLGKHVSSSASRAKGEVSRPCGLPQRDRSSDPFSIRPSFPHMGGGGCFVLQTSLPSVSTKCHRNQLTFLLNPSAKRWLASPLVSMNTGVIVQPLVLSLNTEGSGAVFRLPAAFCLSCQHFAMKKLQWQSVPTTVWDSSSLRI